MAALIVAQTPELKEEINMQEDINTLLPARAQVRDRNGLTDASATPREVFGSET